ncbi:hypothetical protein Vadar_005023 [Vaccinium darrowii]|uniref:Uncharacterized protein n=1 Tax=Vaccinium darrowii TaxID=229202 RepID=A0ACB7WYA8_9ERIC|nr:hypothetical protein Vadar_005023 [Vaccinium darrowii]
MWRVGSGSDCSTHHDELNNMNNTNSDPSSSLRSARKLRPIMPRPLLPISSCTCNFLPKSNILSSSNHHLATIEQDQSKPENNIAPSVTSSRWNPTPEQLRALEELYEGGTRTPTADQIKLIAGMLCRFGKIEGKNVFYWFQNHKARERQKRRRNQSRPSLESEETGFKIGQAKNNATSNCSTISEDSVSFHRAAVASESGTQGWIQLEETELLQKTRTRITQSKHAMWQLMKPSSTPPQATFQFMATPSRSTAAPEGLNLSMNLAPNCRDMDVTKFEEECAKPQTLELFPIRTRDWSVEEREYDVSMASIDNTSFVPNKFFEFLPVKN